MRERMDCGEITMESKMHLSDSEERDKLDIRSLLIPIAMAVSFFLWGLLIFFSVGTKGPPPWGFGNIEDIPGESVYSSHKMKLELGTAGGPPQLQAVEPQHVMGRPAKAQADQEKEQR